MLIVPDDKSVITGMYVYNVIALRKQTAKKILIITKMHK